MFCQWYLMVCWSISFFKRSY